MPAARQVAHQEDRHGRAPAGHKQVPAGVQQPAQGQPGRPEEAQEAQGQDESGMTMTGVLTCGTLSSGNFVFIDRL